MRPTDVKRKLLKENRLGSKSKYQGKGESSARSLSQTTCMEKTTYTPKQESYKTTIYQAERKKRTVVYCFVNGVWCIYPYVKCKEHDHKKGKHSLAGHCQAQFHP